MHHQLTEYQVEQICEWFALLPELNNAAIIEKFKADFKPEPNCILIGTGELDALQIKHLISLSKGTDSKIIIMPAKDLEHFQGIVNKQTINDVIPEPIMYEAINHVKAPVLINEPKNYINGKKGYRKRKW